MNHQKNVCTSILGAIFVESKEHTAIMRKFTHILPKFLQILPGFSLHQNVWGWVAPPSPTPVLLMFFVSFQTWLFLGEGFCRFWLLLSNCFVKFGYKAFWNLATLRYVVIFAVAFAWHSSRLAAGLYEICLCFYKFIYLMPDDSLEREAAVKIGIQYGKLITDSRFYKPPKWKRKTSFRAVASAGCESAVCLHSRFAI